jgi:ribosomal protein L37AE/L43A
MTWHLESAAELNSLYHQIHAECFFGVLPPCRVAWSRRLTRTAGNIDVRARLIKLSVPLLVEAFRGDSLFGVEYMVCGVLCATSQEAVREILKHEMIHLWLHEQGLPSGHTAEFRRQARALGQPKTRHAIALPPPRQGWIYRCPVCKHQFTRRRRYARAIACATCCRQFNGGRYDDRFKLKGRRITEETARFLQPRTLFG